MATHTAKRPVNPYRVKQRIPSRGRESVRFNVCAQCWHTWDGRSKWDFLYVAYSTWASRVKRPTVCPNCACTDLAKLDRIRIDYPLRPMIPQPYEAQP
jgi:hypothetical protein